VRVIVPPIVTMTVMMCHVFSPMPCVSPWNR